MLDLLVLFSAIMLGMGRENDRDKCVFIQDVCKITQPISVYNKSLLIYLMLMIPYFHTIHFQIRGGRHFSYMG